MVSTGDAPMGPASASMNLRISLSGFAPMKADFGWPSTKATTAGIDWMFMRPAISGWSSIFILTRTTAPRLSATTFSITGPNCRQGPHHGAQKSTKTGCIFDASITSCMNCAVVMSLTGAGAVPWLICGACPDWVAALPRSYPAEMPP